jgi:DEAD/DEAH box helicase domain-containing protein
VEAFDHIERGRHLVVSTPTASGKSLIYQVPTLRALRQGEGALFIFPTKALARDQLEKLEGLAGTLGLKERIASYDGDTPSDQREEIRATASCLLTNPDMLHYSILANHSKWARFLSGVRFVVVDELHSYRGVFGVHAANILRRFFRILANYRIKPQVIAASATIGNPQEHAFNLTGFPFEAITEDHFPRAVREFICWQPTTKSSSLEAGRRSALTEATWLLVKCLRAGLKCIFFCNSRKSAELLRRYASGYLVESEAAHLQSYRAGYTARDRRLIETGFKRGDIRVLTATSALELGVDVGDVDVVVLVGYPGSLMALWQRAGRAGRSGSRSLTVLIPGSDPLDEYYLRHPELLTDGSIEDAVADPFNTEIHPLHLACAAAEVPLRQGETYPAPWLDITELSFLIRREHGWVYRGRYPHRRINVRGVGGKRIRLRDGLGRNLGEADFAAALRELHRGAVYLHQGEPFVVMDLDLKEGVAFLVPHIEDYYTQTRHETDIEILDEVGRSTQLASPLQRDIDTVPPAGVSTGRVLVSTDIVSYVRKRYFSETLLDERHLELPSLSFQTQALWIDVTEVSGVVSPVLLPSAMHALEHTLIGLLPAFVLCERADIGGVSYPNHPATGRPIIFIYDGYPGGVGYSRAGAAKFLDWLRTAQELLSQCLCKSGCPRCILSPKCGNGNQHLDKSAAQELATALLEHLNSCQAPQHLA